MFAIIRLFLQTRIADTALWFDENISAMESDSQNHYKPVIDVMEVTENVLCCCADRKNDRAPPVPIPTLSYYSIFFFNIKYVKEIGETFYTVVHTISMTGKPWFGIGSR